MSEEKSLNSAVFDDTESKNASLGNLIKISVKETCKDSTMGGIPHIIKDGSSIILRIIWLISFLVCTGICLWFVSTTIIQYMSNLTYVDDQDNQELST
jgi:hypothetical protein